MLCLVNTPLKLITFTVASVAHKVLLPQARDQIITPNIHLSLHHYCRSHGTRAAEKSSHVSVLRAYDTVDTIFTVR